VEISFWTPNRSSIGMTNRSGQSSKDGIITKM
jgi:hypothetical protein